MRWSHERRAVGARIARRGRSAPAAVIALAVMAGCGDGGVPPPTVEREIPHEERFGGTVVIAGAPELGTFNPAATTDELSMQIQRHALLMTLLRPDENLRAQPYLAESWEINDDSTRVVFHLRRDIRWHDGEPTTAADVDFTFRALKDSEVGFPNAQWFEGWEGPELLDRYTIRFAVRPRAGLLSGWTRLPIMPRHLLGGTEAARLATHPFGTSPVGNGPFRFVERQPGGAWVLEANPDFPEALGGRPYLDRIVYRSIPEPATQLAELRTGGVQFVRFMSPSQISRARSDESISVIEFPSRAYGLIAWNGKRPLFQDPAMRRALTMAIDRQALIDAVHYGLGEIANGPIGPWHPAYDPELAPPPFSPDSAALEFERLGWTDADGDGWRERGGEPLAFVLMTSERDTYRDIATIVQAQLARVGVRVEQETVEGAVLVDAIMSPERRFDAFVLEWVPDLEIDDRQLFSCEAIGEMYQFSSYCNEELEPILQAIPNVRSREDGDRLLRQYVEIVNRDQPFTFLYFARDAAAIRDELRGVELDIRGDLTGIREWWLHPDSRPPRG